MLEQIDLSSTLARDAYKTLMAKLEPKLGALQRAAREHGVPVAIIFEGWDAAGKGTLINRLILSLDPRGFRVYPTNAPTEDERMRPFLWRFWTCMPGRGRIAVFDRSWYGRVLIERVDRIIRKNAWLSAYEEINSFERQLSDDGCIVLKFFLHISQREQKKRFQKLESNSATRWKVTKQDWRHHKQYGRYVQAIEDMLEHTDTACAPWTLIEAHDRRFAVAKIFQTVILVLERRLRSVRARKKRPPRTVTARDPNTLRSSTLDNIDLSATLSRKDYEKALRKCQARLHELEHHVFLQRVPVVIVYEGWDAAGKGGNIRRLVQGMDPRGYEVIPIGAPNDLEKAHHYLWRFWRELPKAGHITVFDRSWYGRVMVERVEGYCAESEWRKAYREINEMESQWAGFGAVVIKFWLHIDKDEQLRRFQTRQKTARKKWKITDEDWRNREKWNAYRTAVDEMLCRTSTTHAPWTIIEANCKLHARIKALKTVIDRLEARCDAT